MSRTSRRIALLGSVSLCAFAAASPGLAAVPILPTNGIAQNADDLIAINIFDLGEDDEPILLGRAEEDIVPGGAAFASANVLCADSASCSSPGALEQFANGVSSAHNGITIGGSLGIEAIAAAQGAAATAIAFIDTAIGQHALADGEASNSLAVTGSIDVLAAADATATQGLAFATALITHAALLSAIGHDASIEVTNDGTISLDSIAHASGIGTAGTAVADALVVGIVAQAAPSEIVPGTTSTIFFASPGAGSASINFTNNGVLSLAAQADAVVEGLAGAHATADRAVAATAIAASGNAAFGVVNSGSILLSGSAHASGLQVATAGGVAAGAIVGFVSAAGVGDANVSVANSGTIDLHAIAVADASTTAVAQAFAGSAIMENAIATTGNAVVGFENSGSFAVEAEASANGDIAFAAAIGGGSVFAGALVELGFAQNGSAVGSFENSGNISVGVDVHANGVSFAQASAFGGPGIDQRLFAIGGEASVSVHNEGLIALHADADAVAATSAFANASILEGILSFAGAQSGGEAVGSFVNDGMLAIDVDANAVGGISGIASAQINRAVTLVASTSAESSGAHLDLANNELLMLDVAATASGDVAGAFATVSQAVFEAASGFGQGPGNANLANDGLISIDAAASAHGATASAIALVEQGVVQLAIGEESATASLTNSGAIDIGALAMAEGDDKGAAFAVATIQGIFQGVSAAHQSISFAGGSTFTSIHLGVTPSGPGLIDFENEGSLSLSAFAAADDGANATALAFVTGASQSALAADLDAVVNNAGTIELAAGAMATASGTAQASAQAFGLGQNITAVASQVTIFANSSGSITNISTTLAGDVSGQVDNSGVLSVQAGAQAQGNLGIAAAAAQGILQEAEATTANLAVANSGTFDVRAMALATGSEVGGGAFAIGLSQAAIGSQVASVSVSNQNDFKVVASVSATGSTRGSASAVATGVHQDLVGLSANAAVTNAGTMTVIANVDVVGSTHVDGRALAAGIRQLPFTEDLSSNFENSGKLSVAAIAAAEAGNNGGGAAATATGFQAYGHNLDAAVSNSGMIGVIARAQALADAGLAQAHAVGIDIAAFPRTGASDATGTIDGTIGNSGILHVLASTDKPDADGMDASTLSQASAIGIRLSSGENNASITNSGTILVEAVSSSATNNGPRATAILAVSNGFIGDGSAVLEINNSGNLIARQSVDGGDSWRHGTAIDVRSAPNNSVLNLNGGSYIYGNIAVHDGDEINVVNGRVMFDGIVGAEFIPTRTVTAGLLDSGLSGAGALRIAGGGNLLLLNSIIGGQSASFDGPAYAIADSLTVDAAGTLTFQLLASEGGTQEAGTYSQIFVDTASLAGSLVAEIVTPNGLYADDYFWDNVIDANVRNGQFGSCQAPGADSLLLSFTCTYDDDANVDLHLTRVAFDAVDGLNRNGGAVAASIEDGYDPGSTGPGIAPIVALFKIADPASYRAALNQLSGSAYANHLQSFQSLGVRHNDLVDSAIACEGQPLAASVLECRAPPTVRFWSQVDFEHRTSEGDDEAGRLRSNRSTTLFGVDAKAGEYLLLGLAAGIATNHGRDRQFGDQVDADGSLLGAYAVFDPGPYYVKGVATYSWYDGDSRRTIDFGGFKSRPKGDPDADLFTIGLHGGARVPLGGILATPFANLDHVRAKLEGFAETNGAGGELTVKNSRSSHTFVTAGVKLATQIGHVLPDARFGIRHRFGDERARVDAALAGVDDDGFSVISAAQSRSTFLAGLGVAGKIGKLDLRIAYEAELNGDVDSHSGTLKLVLPLGKSK